MTKDKGIIIKNIYFMLAYAFQVLKQSRYEEIAAQEFDHIQDLFAAILAKGAAQQVKQGLYREYIAQHEALSVMRGKLEIEETIKNRMQRKQRLACAFDALSENNLYNQILKTTMDYLICDDGVKAEHKADLNKVRVFFGGIDGLEPSAIAWNRLHFQRLNRNYEMLLSLCRFVLEGMLQTTEKGQYHMAAFSDEHMARLFERFILAYFRKHHAYLNEIKAAQIRWNLTGENDETMISFLPVMQTDIMLRMGEKILIIDAKYYGRTLQQHYDKSTLHSGNLYQMFAYVKNKDKEHTGKVSGLLLYAKTEEAVTPDCTFSIGGNRISAKTLDLNTNFQNIALQLDEIVRTWGES